MLLGINKLQHADHFVLLILHGENQHGLGPVTELLVKVTVEPEGKMADAIGVLDVQNLAGSGGVAGDAVRVDGHRKLAEGNGVTVALRKFEDQVLAVTRFLFHQVKRAGVGGSDLATLAQNELEQRVGVALRGKRHPDLVECFEIGDRPP